MSVVVIGSQNPVKIACTQRAFEKVFPDSGFHFTGIPTQSGVSDQPISDEETLTGAKNRAMYAMKNHPEADFWVGIEGGLEHDSDNEMTAFAWVYIHNRQLHGKSRTATFQLPKAISHLIDQGIELGEADDIVFKRENSKQNSGAVGILTHELIN